MTKIILLLFICIFFGCDKQDINRLAITPLKSIKKHPYPIFYCGDYKLHTTEGEDIYQFYYLWNNTKDTIYVKTMRKDYFNYAPINVIYGQHVMRKIQNDNQGWHFSFESLGNYALDSVMVKPKGILLHVEVGIHRNTFDSLLYDIKLKIKHDNTYKDTLIRKKMRLYNNEKFVEDTAYWPAIEGLLKQRH